MGMYYGGQNYIFSKNLQGDVIGIYNENRQLVAKYSYNAYGEIMSITDASGNDVSSNSAHIANINPFRYRGYYYDTETGFYYLQSRYYDPVVGRFLNADAIIGANGGIIGYNAFAYCNNNPVMKYDPSGYDAIVLTNDGAAGHTGIMVQDEDGVWYHFYWGASDGNSSSSGSSSSASPFGCEAKTWCKIYEGDISLDDINASGQYGGTYDRMERLYGDFSTCLTEMQNPSGEYNLYTNNCLDKSFSILASADTIYKDALQKGAKKWRPTKGHDTLCENMPVRPLFPSWRHFVIEIMPIIIPMKWCFEFLFYKR